MKKVTFVVAIIVMLLVDNRVQAGVSIVMNGSFENDGSIDNIAVKAPRRWCNVDVPATFYGRVLNSADWSTHGEHYLFLASFPFTTFAVGDTATVSQDVYLSDVNEIIFDVNLSTTYDDPWDPARRTVFLMIDEEVAWDSNSLGTNDIRGGYFDQICTVAEKHKDANRHTLSLGLRVNVGGYSDIYYQSKWDFVKFDTHCGGFGHLPEDLNHDCYVGMKDLAMLAGQWLVDDANCEYDLLEDDEDIVNLRDFAILANSWLDYRDWKNWQDPNFVVLELPAADLNDDGTVDLRDFAILAKDWAGEGDCIRGDIDRSGIVDYKDISKLAGEWLLKSWLYGLE